MQRELFPNDLPLLPPGCVYRPDFLTEEEEAELLSWFIDLPFEHGRLGEYTAKRRVIGFGWGYDFREKRLIEGPPLPPFLRPLARKVAKWLDIPKHRVVEALITEYPKGAAIGWHRDNEAFEHIVGVSLAGPATLRLRPISWRVRGRRRTRADVVSLPVVPRSAYLLQHEARWECQHSVPKVKGLRYSITFRTLPKGLHPRPKNRAGSK